LFQDLAAGWLVLKLMAFRHRYKASRTTQNLFFKKLLLKVSGDMNAARLRIAR
jgi:hypothetical protein